MKLRAKHFSLLMAAILPLALAAGCGGAGAPTASAPADGAVFANSLPGFKLAPDAVRRGLGALLDGTPTITYEDSGMQIMAGDSALPPVVDLRPRLSPVADQGQLGACTGFALVKGLREYLLMRETGKLTPLSAGFLWYLERKEHGWPTENKGAYISVGMKILDNIGTATEASFPYPTAAEQADPVKIKELIAKRPQPAEIQAAKSHRIPGTQQINSLHGIRKQLASGYPVVIGIAIYESFYTIGKDGMTPIPNPDKEKLEGGHAVTVVGYDNARKQLIIKNSWSAAWGDQGYFYLPYQFLKAGFAHDGWTIKPR